MSSVGQAIGGLVGGVIGFMVGGPGGALYGAQLGIMAGGLVDPAKIQGPRLNDLSFQTSTYGAIVPRVYGTVAMNGNVFWLQGNRLTERTTTSSAKGGPELTSYSYYATFAVGLCQGPIDGVRRIWIGGELWYDAGATDIDSIIVSNEKSELFTLYLGTDTQTADPLIQADQTVFDVPAYRGLAYIVFDSLPLEKYGNSLMGAQVKVEVVKDGTVAGWTRRVTNTDTTIDFAGTAPGVGQPYIVKVLDGVIIVGIYNSTTQYKFDLNGVFLGISTSLDKPCLSNSGNYYACGKLGGNHLYARLNVTSANGVMLCYEDTLTGGAAGTGPRIDGSLPNNRMIYGVSISNDGNSALVFLADVGVDPLGGGTILDPVWYEIDKSGNIIRNGTVLSGPVTPITINLSRASVLQYGAASYDQKTDTIAHAYGAGLGPISIYEIGSDNIIRAATSPGNLSFFSFTYVSVYLDSNIVYAFSKDHYNTFTYGLLTDSTVSLSSIVQAECLTSKFLESSDIDVTQLTDYVRGYRVSQIGPIRNAIEPLRAVWPFDVVQHGYDIQFKKRGSASVATISADDLDARPAGQAPGVEISDSREMDLQLPQKVSVKYLDAVREYDINEQSEERANTDAVNHATIELPVVMNADEAKQTASMLLYLMWLERYDVAFSLSPEYLELEPGDVITVSAYNATYQLRLTSVNTTADGRLECKAKYDSAAVYVQTGSAGEEGQSTGGTLTVAGPTEVALLDIPLMRDDDDTAGFPMAMCGYLEGWPGGTLYRSEDDGQSWLDIVARTSPGAVIGYASTSLSAHGGTMLDKASTLTVRLYSGELASVTEAQMFAGANWFAYGADGRWEIIAAQVATLQGDGSYILTDFMRGQKGTEWATGLHVANDRIVLLDEAALNFVSVNSSSIGSEKLYRAITFGKAIDSEADSAFTYSGVNLECLSPVNLTGYNHASNNWELFWTRRSRYGDWRDYIDAPLGEASESYEIDVYSSGTYATLKRTLTATTNSVQYSSANQVTDFGSNQSTLYLKIYQLSASVGRGYPLTASITR